jgi:NADH-quinone oxidoreductase subunit E
LAGIAALVDKVVDKYDKDKDMLIQILLDLQKGFGWLPSEALAEVSVKLRVPVARVYQVASFYKAFSFSPKGRHAVTVCVGTACQVRGAPRLLDRIGDQLDLKEGETSSDMRFSLDTVNCLGCCALGPVMVIDGKYHSNPPTEQLERIFEGSK